MLSWLKTAQGMLPTFAAALAIVAWWNLGLPCLVFSDEAPIRAPIEALERCNRDTRLLCSTSPAGAPIPSASSGRRWRQSAGWTADSHPGRRGGLLQEKYEAPASSRAPSVTSIAAEVLATAASKARVSSIALEALVSVAATPGVPTSSHNAAIVMFLGA
jgi:hypothetical protein